MTDSELKIKFEKSLRELAEKHNIYSLAEQNSYFKYVVSKGIVICKLPDMEHNEFMTEAVQLAFEHSLGGKN